MNFLIRCSVCKAEEWLKGWDEPDTNSCGLDEELSCGHGDYTIVDSRYEDPNGA